MTHAEATYNEVCDRADLTLEFIEEMGPYLKSETFLSLCASHEDMLVRIAELELEIYGE